MAYASKHAKTKTKERLGLSKNIADKNADKAFEHGLRHGDCKGGLKRYIDGLYLRYKRGSDYRIYNHHVYLFDVHTNKLITVIDLPQSLCKLADKLQAKRKENEA